MMTVDKHRPTTPEKPYKSAKWTIRFAIAVLLMYCGVEVFAAMQNDAHESAIEIRLAPNPVVNGNVVLLEIDAGNLADPVVGIQAKFKKMSIPVYEHPARDAGYFIGLIGIGYYHKPEKVSVKLEWTNRQGYHSKDIALEITKGRFKREKLNVPPRKVKPSKKAITRITRERRELKTVFASSQAARLWHASFKRPVTGKVTSPFGSMRLLNGKVRSYHGGVDFRAPTGTPIYAANDGIVRMAKNLFYSGNHVIVDHGMELFTSYSHLSEFSVEPGQHVSRGQQIGLSGATGRVNGPHLHWSARINGVKVDPLQLMELVNSLFDASDTQEFKIAQ
jgi:hypothetical protein